MMPGTARFSTIDNWVSANASENGFKAILEDSPTRARMVAIQLNNYVTQSRSRVKANKNVSKEEFAILLDRAARTLTKGATLSSKANLNGVIVELITNSEHQHAFWNQNWWPANASVLAHAHLYSVIGIEGMEPGAFYCPPLGTALFVNTEYYGQCKSWALGMAAAILERRFNTLSIHGATAQYKGKGVVIIAPTGTGKTTHSFRIFMNDEGKICGDDWAYVEFPPGTHSAGKRLVARQPERALYMRTESQKEEPWLRPVFDRSLTENVAIAKEGCDYIDGAEGCSLSRGSCVFNQGMKWCYYSFGNSRALVKREDLLGPDKVVDEVPINLVVLLRRDDHSPPEVRLTADEAIAVLQKGEYMVLPGAGPKEKWGSISNEPWYNPYLLELDSSAQERFFRSMFGEWKVPCVILNTGVEGIEESHRRIISALEAS